MKKKDFLWSLLTLMTVGSLSLGSVSCSKDEKDDVAAPSTLNTNSGTESNLVVSPYQIQLTSEKDSKGSFTISTNSEWTISNVPQWLTLSALSGQGLTQINITANEENRNDAKRSANIHITSGSASKDITVDQLPAYVADCRITVSNELILSNGFYANLKYEKNVYGYVEGYYYASALNTKTEKEIYEEVKNNSSALAKDYDYAMTSLPAASTAYIYCVIGYDKNRNFGPMTIYKFTTKSSSTTSDATIGTISYSSSYWSYTISKQSRCHHFYMLHSANSAAEYVYTSYPDIMLAYAIKDRIADPEYPNYDYNINGGTMRTTRQTSDTAFLVWTWGVNDKDEFSGNIQKSYRDISSSAPLNNHIEVSNEDFPHFDKPTRAELDYLKEQFIVACEN